MSKWRITFISLILLELIHFSPNAHAYTATFSSGYTHVGGGNYISVNISSYPYFFSSYYPSYYGAFHRYYGTNPFYPRVRFPGPTPWQRFRDYLSLKEAVEEKMASYYSAKKQDRQKSYLDDPVPQEFYEKVEKEEQERAKEIEIDVLPNLEESPKIEEPQDLKRRGGFETRPNVSHKLTQSHKSDSGAVMVEFFPKENISH